MRGFKHSWFLFFISGFFPLLGTIISSQYFQRPEIHKRRVTIGVINVGIPGAKTPYGGEHISFYPTMSFGESATSRRPGVEISLALSDAPFCAKLQAPENPLLDLALACDFSWREPYNLYLIWGRNIGAHFSLFGDIEIEDIHGLLSREAITLWYHIGTHYQFSKKIGINYLTTIRPQNLMFAGGTYYPILGANLEFLF